MPLVYNTTPVSYTHLDVYKRQIETLLYRMGYRPYNEETIKACEEARNGEFAGEVDTTNKSTIEASLFDDEA